MVKKDATSPDGGSDQAGRGPAPVDDLRRGGGGVHVVAGSGPVDRERVVRGLAHVRRELDEPTLAPNLFERQGYFAGSDERRLTALDAALRDERATVVWAARGGYGLTRLLGRLDPAPLRERPKLIVGFSDVSALLCWAWAHAQVPSIHGPVVGQLARLPPEDRERLWQLIRGELPAPLVAEEHAEDGATVLCGGRVEGRLFVSNLEVLRTLIGTPHLPPLAGGILAIEEIGERPYRLDRALTQLLDSGALGGVAGVAVGSLHGCVEPKDGGSQGWSAAEVIEDRLGRLGVPVVCGLPFGHGPDRNAALGFGVMARLDADAGSLEMLEPVVGTRGLVAES